MNVGVGKVFLEMSSRYHLAQAQAPRRCLTKRDLVPARFLWPPWVGLWKADLIGVPFWKVWPLVLDPRPGIGEVLQGNEPSKFRLL